MSSCREAKYYKTAMHGNVQASDSCACIGFGTARGGNSETCAFDAISIKSVQKHELFHVVAQAPLRQGRDVVFP